MELIGRSAVDTALLGLFRQACGNRRFVLKERTKVLTMAIGPAAKSSQRAAPRSADVEAFRIGAAMQHIKARGNLDGFPADRGERLALVSTAARQGFVAWNKSRGKYELTSHGHRHLRALHRGERNALREHQGGAIRSGMNAIVTAAGVVVVVGGIFLAFNPSLPTSLAIGGQPGAYFTTSSAVPAAVQPRAVQGTRPAGGVEAKPVAAVAGGSAEFPRGQTSARPDAGRADAAAPAVSIATGEPGRSLAAVIGSEPEVATGSVAKLANEDPDKAETSKLAHKPKRSTRKYDAPGPAYGPGPGYRPGYAYSPYGYGGSRYWSAPPWYR